MCWIRSGSSRLQEGRHCSHFLHKMKGHNMRTAGGMKKDVMIQSTRRFLQSSSYLMLYNAVKLKHHSVALWCCCCAAARRHVDVLLPSTCSCAGCVLCRERLQLLTRRYTSAYSNLEETHSFVQNVVTTALSVLTTL